MVAASSSRVETQSWRDGFTYWFRGRRIRALLPSRRLGARKTPSAASAPIRRVSSLQTSMSSSSVRMHVANHECPLAPPGVQLCKPGPGCGKDAQFEGWPSPRYADWDTACVAQEAAALSCRAQQLLAILFLVVALLRGECKIASIPRHVDLHF